MEHQDNQPVAKKTTYANLIDLERQQVVTIILKLAKKRDDKFIIPRRIMREISKKFKVNVRTI